MDYLPIFADVRNRRVLVVGEGELASSKIRLLQRAGADVVRRAPTDFRPDDIGGCAAVLGASGDADLLTVQALRLMRQADIVAHDQTIGGEILDRVRRGAVRINGADETIADRLVRETKLGKRVLWLVAEHAGANIDELRRRGVAVIVAPGLTRAAIAAWRGDNSQKVAV